MQQQRENPTESTVNHPPEASMGGDNTTYVPCDVHHSRKHYGVCLNTIKAFEEDRLGSAMVDCARAIGGRYCPSLTMKEEEAKAGKALYYQPRQIRVKIIEDDAERKPVSGVDKNSLSYKRGWNAVKGKPVNDLSASAKPAPTRRVTRKPAAPVKPVSDLERGMNDAGDMTQVINQAAAEPTSEPQATVTKSSPQSGDSQRQERIRKAREAALMMRRGK